MASPLEKAQALLAEQQEAGREAARRATMSDPELEGLFKNFAEEMTSIQTVAFQTSSVIGLEQGWILSTSGTSCSIRDMQVGVKTCDGEPYEDYYWRVGFLGLGISVKAMPYIGGLYRDGAAHNNALVADSKRMRPIEVGKHSGMYKPTQGLRVNLRNLFGLHSIDDIAYTMANAIDSSR